MYVYIKSRNHLTSKGMAGYRKYPILFHQTLLHKCENRYKRICGVCMMVIENSEANKTLKITLDLRRCFHL